MPLFYVISHYFNLPFRAWEQRKLGEVTESFDGKRVPIDSGLRISGEYPYYGATGIIDYVDDYIFDGEYVLLAEDGANITMRNYPVAYLTQGKFWLNNHAHIMRMIDGSNYFLVQVLEKIDYMKYNTGTAQPKLNSKVVKNIEFKLPHVEEQRKIGTFFKKIDDTIALHQRKLDALKLMKKAFSQQIFPKNNRKKPKIRFTSFYEEWEQRKIGEYGYFYYGKSAPKWSVAQDATTPCVRYGELYTKFGPEIDIVHSYTNIDKSNLKFSSGNEVLVPRVGENPLDFANCSWLSISNVAIGEMISVYNTEQYPLFIAYYFRSKMKYEFAKRVEGGNVSNLYYSYLEDILISVPSIEEQKKIAEFLNKIDITINLLQNKLGRIKELKKAYLQNMFI
ncbi:TPA: restriction endonuclease subunit S [Listeria monocytogenes]|nr:restriction endonuclease subunit S [Listeria monocytogenes]HAO6139594.1 restriction endonuclease subunit S [Listeria monocytogenes]